MAPWLEVTALVCGLIAMLAPLPLILAGRATGWTWVGIALGATSLTLLATVLLVSAP